MSPTSADPRPSVRSSSLRVRIEHASDPVLQRLSRLPSNTVVIVLLVVLVAGLVVRGWVGAILLGVVALAHGWGIYLAWPRLSGLERQMRLAVLMLVIALAAVCLISAVR
ncbi:DUF6703 family protein [Allobranchiibius sp. CTAmp26]|uniref:DUF6703 family protein n=1 Tax=Allobranchiibius sp. CTAmp26 TaxID=2815214 RepID=UPI001AA0DF92|nr:DUF6703 family protein [Allobranchiibius sp. CTAmp26]MBO1754740.1 hypothetical protein [Allobranchiibius sp. CTAmp26]